MKPAIAYKFPQTDTLKEFEKITSHNVLKYDNVTT